MVTRRLAPAYRRSPRQAGNGVRRTSAGDGGLPARNEVNSKAKVAIIAALKREVEPLIRDWQKSTCKHEGRTFTFYQNPQAVLVCGGIGADAARRATEAAIALFHPQLLISAGFAGGLTPEMQAGCVVTPSTIVDARDGSRTETGIGSGVLVTVNSTAMLEAKQRLAESYAAQLVDMEAAAVAKGAQTHGLPCVALKAISDESSFHMLPMDRFISADGGFHERNLILFAGVRPWLWGRMLSLARNSRRAAKALCRSLDRFNYDDVAAPNPGLQSGRRIPL